MKHIIGASFKPGTTVAYNRGFGVTLNAPGDYQIAMMLGVKNWQTEYSADGEKFITGPTLPANSTVAFTVMPGDTLPLYLKFYEV